MLSQIDKEVRKYEKRVQLSWQSVGLIILRSRDRASQAANFCRFKLSFSLLNYIINQSPIPDLLFILILSSFFIREINYSRICPSLLYFFHLPLFLPYIHNTFQYQQPFILYIQEISNFLFLISIFMILSLFSSSFSDYS